MNNQKLEIKTVLVSFYNNANQKDYLNALETAINQIQAIKTINPVQSGRMYCNNGFNSFKNKNYD